jgi:hypothetical protein
MGVDAARSPFSELLCDPGMAPLGADSPGRLPANAKLPVGELVALFPGLAPLAESAPPRSDSNTRMCAGVEFPGSNSPMADLGYWVLHHQPSKASRSRASKSQTHHGMELLV